MLPTIFAVTTACDFNSKLNVAKKIHLEAKVRYQKVKKMVKQKHENSELYPTKYAKAEQQNEHIQKILISFVRNKTECKTAEKDHKEMVI